MPVNTNGKALREYKWKTVNTHGKQLAQMGKHPVIQYKWESTHSVHTNGKALSQSIQMGKHSVTHFSSK